MQRNNFRPSVKITAGILVCAAVAGLFEVAARVVYTYREEVRNVPVVAKVLQRSLILDPYEMASPNGLYHWVLRPGYEADQQTLIRQKQKAGRVLGATIVQGSESERKGKKIIRVNPDGFRGPDLDKTHARPRILALGDSTTFGTGGTDYPRRIERILNLRGIPVEVVNGGVEGYFPRNLNYEINRYKSLKPEIVVLYIGWNSLFSEVPWDTAWQNRFRGIWLYEQANKVITSMVNDPREFAMRMYNRELKPVPDSGNVEALETYTPPFMGRVERLIDEFESIGTRVVLVTLPGLFTMTLKPSRRALKIGHLPIFTSNPFVLAKLTERYNIALRGLAKRRGAGLIDLENWSTKALQPRDAYFSDSVHLTPKGLNLIGTFMAEQLSEHFL